MTNFAYRNTKPTHTPTQPNIPLITMNQQQQQEQEFKSPFEELELSHQLSNSHSHFQNSTAIKYLEATIKKQQIKEQQQEWQPAFPEEQTEKQSLDRVEAKRQAEQTGPVKSEQSQSVKSEQSEQVKSEHQSSEKNTLQDNKLSQISIQSIPQSIKDKDLSLSFDQDFNLDNLQFEDFDFNPLKQQYNYQQNYDTRIRMDLNQVFQQLGEDRNSKVLKSRGGGMEVRDEEWYRRQDKVVAARAFINRGYGINQLKEELRCGNYGTLKIDDARYKSVAGSMVRESFRKLQAFLLRDCQQKLHSMAGYEMKLLQTLLLNCRTTLPPLHSRYFMQIVSITYQITETSITQPQCLELYNAIYRSLQKKIALLRGQRMSDSYSSEDRPRRQHPKCYYSGQVDPNIITATVEREIIQQYIVTPSLSQVRDAIRAKHHLSETKLNVKVVRNILRRIMRAAIRRMEDIMADRGLRGDYRNYQRLCDQKIKHILEVGDALKLRGQVCRVYLGGFADTKLVEKSCRELYDFVQEKERPKNKVHSISID